MLFKGRVLLITICVGAMLTASLQAQQNGDYYGGLEAFRQGDWEKAIKDWAPLVTQGDAEAIYRLALLYESAPAPYTDPPRALELYRQLATAGNPRAQNNLGRLYETGFGTAVDETQAARWYREAARQGRSIAQANLARMYEDGRGGDRSLKEALRWYRAAAGQGHAASQNRVGYAYATGNGLPADDGQAARWFKRAAKHGLASAENNQAVFLDSGRGGKHQPGKALDGFTRAAAQDLVAARTNLALKYRAGHGVIRDRVKADAWQQQVAGRAMEPFTLLLDLDVTPEIVQVVTPVMLPSTVEKTEQPPRSDDTLTADQWYARGQSHASGEGRARNLAAAEQAFLRAAERSHGMAAYKLGWIYMRGHTADGKPNLVEAYRWFRTAAEAEIGDAANWQDRLVDDLTRKERRELGIDN